MAFKATLNTFDISKSDMYSSTVCLRPTRVATLPVCPMGSKRHKIYCRGSRRVPMVSASAHPYSLNFNNAVDKAHEVKRLHDIVSLPPSSLQGLSERSDALLAILHIHSVKDLGNYKFYKAAKAIAMLAATEVSCGYRVIANAQLTYIYPFLDFLGAWGSACQLSIQY